MGKLDQVTELLKAELGASPSTETKPKEADDGGKPAREAGEGADGGVLQDEESTGDTGEEGEGDTGGDAGENEGEADQEAPEVTEARKALDEEREEVNNQAIENMRYRRELDAIIELMGDQVPAHIAETYKQLHNAVIERESAALRRVLPKWDNPKTAEYEQKLIMDMARKYGISKGEIEATITDHRLVKMLRDMSLFDHYRKERQTQPARAARRHTGGAQDAIKRATAPNATKQDKLAAIAALIT